MRKMRFRRRSRIFISIINLGVAGLLLAVEGPGYLTWLAFALVGFSIVQLVLVYRHSRSTPETSGHDLPRAKT